MRNTHKKRHAILLVGTGSIDQRHTMLLAERQDVDLWLCDTSDACLEQVGRVEHVGVERIDLMREQTATFLKAVQGEGLVSCTGVDGTSILRVIEAAL